MVNRLIDACADVDEEYMIRETPIQVAAVLGDFEIATRLVNCGANPYLSTINYDSLKCNFRNFGAPSVRNFTKILFKFFLGIGIGCCLWE
jgi:hypothetical protein